MSKILVDKGRYKKAMIMTMIAPSITWPVPHNLIIPKYSMTNVAQTTNVERGNARNGDRRGMAHNAPVNIAHFHVGHSFE